MIETRTITSTNSITCRPNRHGPEGDTVLESNDAVYRFLRAAADLFLDGLIDADELIEHAVRWMPGDDAGRCPAARQIGGSIMLAVWEPDCGCDIYRETPCEHPARTDDDRREDLRQMMGL